MAELTMSNYKPFVSEGTRTLKVATVRKDGRPHVAPVWFVVDGDGIVFATSENSVKGKDLLRDPRVCLLVENEEPPYGYAIMEGKATLSPNPPDQLDWNIRLAARYVGRDQAEAFGRRNTADDTLVVRVTPERVTGYDNVTE
jgi:PPOX class probable F420-dependent enzyme